VVPYAAVLYAPDGSAFTFTNPARLAYVHLPIRIAHIRDGLAFLRQGPAPGTAVVTVGGDELLGAEAGIHGQSH
jgi:hypothetical protein